MHETRCQVTLTLTVTVMVAASGSAGRSNRNHPRPRRKRLSIEANWKGGAVLRYNLRRNGFCPTQGSAERTTSAEESALRNHHAACAYWYSMSEATGTYSYEYVPTHTSSVQPHEKPRP